MRGDLTDNFYYGFRLETSQNERSTWNTFGEEVRPPYYGSFSKANSYSIHVGLAYLGWRPTPWLDISIGRVPQPLYTTPMVWDSDYTPEGAVEKLNYTVVRPICSPPLDNLCIRTRPRAAAARSSSSGTARVATAYLMSWQAGVEERSSIQGCVGQDRAGALQLYGAWEIPAPDFSGPFVGQGEANGLQFATN